MTKKLMSKSYMTPNEVADILMVSPTAVRLWAEKGELNALSTPGGHRRYLLADVERFARQRQLTLNTNNSDTVRILIVDDDEPLSRYLKIFISEISDKAVVDIANDGFLAGYKIREFNPHIVLLDLMMPDLTGFLVCEQLKNDPNTRAIRVIAMTGYPSDENINQIMDAGAEACLLKPIDEDKLTNCLNIKINSMYEN